MSMDLDTETKTCSEGNKKIATIGKVKKEVSNSVGCKVLISVIAYFMYLNLKICFALKFVFKHGIVI